MRIKIKSKVAKWIAIVIVLLLPDFALPQSGKINSLCLRNILTESELAKAYDTLISIHKEIKSIMESKRLNRYDGADALILSFSAYDRAIELQNQRRVIWLYSQIQPSTVAEYRISSAKYSVDRVIRQIEVAEKVTRQIIPKIEDSEFSGVARKYRDFLSELNENLYACK